jgi:hypothetical protein
VNIGSLPIGLALLPLLLIGCAPMAPVNPPEQPGRDAMQALQTEVAQLSGELVELQSTLATMRDEQQAVVTELDLQNRALGRVEGAVTTLPDALKQLCPAPRVIEAQCEEPQLQRVVVSGNKMVVGELEQVWLDPPGMAFNARIETSTSNNALRAEDIVEFERDGKGWVRFVLHPPDSDRRIELERRVALHLRTAQSGDTEGAKRPIVKMRLKLGDVEDTFSFVLTDRTDVDYQVVLGRSFLKDIAFVEIGARYVQPRIKQKAAPKAAPKPAASAAAGPATDAPTKAPPAQ